MLNVDIKTNYFWSFYHIGSSKLYLKGVLYSHTVSNILDIIKSISKKDVANFINSLDGHFAIVVQKEDFSFIAVDKIRSTQIFFTKIEDKFYVDYNPKKLVKKIGFKKDIKSDAVLELFMSGYTIGNHTVYKNLKSLKAGELVIFSSINPEYIQYYGFFGNIEYKNYDSLLEELSELTLNIFRKMLSQIGDRQIIIPLSAGNDSRLIASILKHLGAINVKCYSYGSIGNFEANIAQNIAKKLEYEYIFIPLSYKSEKNYYASEDYKKYLNFSETYSSIPYIQSLSTVKYLKDMDWIDDNAIFINGNSGDFISGAHINSLVKSVSTSSNQKNRKENILENLVDKHFSLWGHLKTKGNIEKIKTSLWNEIALVHGNELNNKEKDHLLYEYSEFINRQSKYVITGQKIYEFYNYDWRLPLWDVEYLFFWQKVPVEFKEKQKLYVDMLKKKNFGNVWGSDIPVNRKNITPRYVIPIRFVVKIFFSLFGNSGKIVWRQFDKVVFNYWMINTHTLKAFSYFRILADFSKKPRGIYACWASDSYVNKFKGLISKCNPPKN
jgi:asparagine synthase (glutamine-hydrolysing)